MIRASAGFDSSLLRDQPQVAAALRFVQQSPDLLAVVRRFWHLWDGGGVHVSSLSPEKLMRRIEALIENQVLTAVVESDRDRFGWDVPGQGLKPPPPPPPPKPIAIVNRSDVKPAAEHSSPKQQAETKQKAAKAGAPFCEICAAAAAAKG